MFVENFLGCENGRKYKWSSWWCYGWLTGGVTPNVRKCFAAPLKDKGPCDPLDSLSDVGGVSVASQGLTSRGTARSRVVGGIVLLIASVMIIIQGLLSIEASMIPIAIGLTGLIVTILTFFRKGGIGGFFATVIALIILLLQLLSILNLDLIIIYLVILLLIGGLIAFFGAERCSSVTSE